jgi:hypothetical protein
VTFVGIPAQDTDDAMRAFVDRHGLGAMPQVVDDEGDLWARFGVRVQPAWVFVPDDGEPVAVYGPLTGEALDERLETSFG